MSFDCCIEVDGQTCPAHTCANRTASEGASQRDEKTPKRLKRPKTPGIMFPLADLECPQAVPDPSDTKISSLPMTRGVSACRIGQEGGLATEDQSVAAIGSAQSSYKPLAEDPPEDLHRHKKGVLGAGTGSH